jgi:DNA-binding CsgD family transcriptional regulator
MTKCNFAKTRELLSVAKNHEEIVEIMKDSFSELGFNEWTYFLQMLDSQARASVIGFINLPTEWMSRYLEMGYDKIDPITSYYMSNNLPLIWDARADWSGLGEGVVNFMDDMRSFGFTGGLCIPIFTAQNTRGFLNFVERASSLDCLYESLDGRAAQATFLVRYVHEAILRVAMESAATPYHNPLTRREKEVLLWVGEGLTSKAIADRLGISFRTVEHYLAVIQRKMSVANRQQAVTKAVCLGFVLPVNMYQTPSDPVVKLVYART